MNKKAAQPAPEAPAAYPGPAKVEENAITQELERAFARRYSTRACLLVMVDSEGKVEWRMAASNAPTIDLLLAGATRAQVMLSLNMEAQGKPAEEPRIVRPS